MDTPKYDLSSHLLGNLTTIERLYGNLESLRIPAKLEINLERHNLIRSSYASNRIEGNPLTLPEVTNLLLDDRTPVNRDEKEVVNYFGILKRLDEYARQPLSVELVVHFHKNLMTGVDKAAGTIRNVQVVIGKYREEKGNVSLTVKHNPPFHDRKRIIAATAELLSWADKSGLPTAITAGLFHHQFVYIHPFEDGNGRVCRILTALLFLRAGYRINRYFILDDYYDIDRQQYSDKLHSADTGAKTEWLEYFSDGVKFSLQSALAKYENALRQLRFAEKPTPRENQVLKILTENREASSADISRELKVSRQQSHALLRSLLDKGLIEKKGSTKSSYYFIK
ncbi:hypothetical protein A2Z33_05180 [Candidatus Gottesmanbacteria bacterium RBG_16_52_11]|uniref:Fido domain-containing protein n=1 Tax=Candidatus Gottesmanbacteria bacterium RBG_16_52_11 TaxID=1798374 RepID=A0A1F5YQR9_9BACT|nr:MAG: hypothetical protein A2Z33_05180 [Candidatus Gottesmanbacteria bacterium RBG_16_52_11]